MQKIYDEAIAKYKKKPNYLINGMKAFVIGGLICLIGQLLIYLFESIFHIEHETSVTLMIVTLILISSLATGIGIYDKLGQYAGAGSIVPITGFANSMTSSALESKSEGIILGIATNLFKLAGCVITIGVVSAYVLGSLRYLYLLIFGG